MFCLLNFKIILSFWVFSLIIILFIALSTFSFLVLKCVVTFFLDWNKFFSIGPSELTHIVVDPFITSVQDDRYTRFKDKILSIYFHFLQMTVYYSCFAFILNVKTGDAILEMINSDPISALIWFSWLYWRSYFNTIINWTFRGISDGFSPILRHNYQLFMNI